MVSYVLLMATPCDHPTIKVIDLHVKDIRCAWSTWMLAYKAEMAIVAMLWATTMLQKALAQQNLVQTDTR